MAASKKIDDPISASNPKKASSKASQNSPHLNLNRERVQFVKLGGSSPKIGTGIGMRPQSSWNLSNVSPDARTAASAAAQSEGISLGEWLTRQILAEFQAQESTRDLAQSLDRLDDQMLGLAERLNEIEEQVQASALRDAIEKLHDGLTRLNTELVQTTGSTTIQTSALAAKTAALAGQLDDIRAEAERKTKTLEADFERMGGSFQTHHTAFEDNVARINADISTMRAQFSEKSDAGDQSVAQLENRLSEATRHLDELRSVVAAAREEAAGSVKTLQQWLQAAFASSSSQAFKIESELETLDANLGSVRADVSARSRDFDQRLKDIYEQTLSRISQLTGDIGGLASQATDSGSRIANELQAAHERHKAIEDRVISHETRVASEINSRDADHAAFRSDVLGKVEALQSDLGAVNSATAQNSAATSELSAITDSLGRNHKDVTEKADTLERELAELREKFDAASGDALKISSALSEIHIALRQDSERKTKNIADVESATNALRGELSRLESESAGKLAGVETSLVNLREQSSQDISALKAELDDANEKFGASHGKSMENLAALEQRFATHTEQSGADIHSLAEKVDTVDSRFVQAYAAIADTRQAAEPRLAGVEQGLADLGAKFSAANEAMSESHGALRQLLNQLANQSTGEFGSLKAKVESIGGALNGHQGDMAQTSAAMKERVEFACQAIEKAEARHQELSGLLAASQEREIAAANAIRALEKKLHLLESRFPAPATTQIEEPVALSVEPPPVAQSQDEQHQSGETIDPAESNATVEIPIPVPAATQIEEPVEPPVENALVAQAHDEHQDNSEAKGQADAAAAVETPKAVETGSDAGQASGNRAADFDEWDYYDDEPQIVLPPVVLPVVRVAQVSANPQPASFQHQEQETLAASSAQDEHHESDRIPAASISNEPLLVLPPQPLQSDAAQEGEEPLPIDTSEPAPPTLDLTESGLPESPSFISTARLAAKAAAERADAEQAEIGAFRKYFTKTGDEASSTQKLRKSGVQLGAAAMVLAACFAAAKYFASSQSVLPRAQADIHTPAASLHKPGAHVVQAGVRKDQAHTVESAANGLDRTTALALAGDAKAQLSIGLHYLARGDDAANGSEAVKWLGLSANQGNAIAQYRLGALYAAGHGVPADQAHAAQLYESAANLGNRRAMYNLALAYMQGQGVSKNSSEAVRWFLKAANLGLVDAQFDLAVLYERGTGVPQSLLDAYRWYAIAAKSGDKESQQRVQALATQIPSTDQAAAQKSADEFKALAVAPDANNVTGTL